jgi:hypothetical protein
MIASQNCRPVATSVATLLVVGLVTVDSLAVRESDEWSEAVNVGPIVNSAFNDTCPAISKNGLSLYFASNRPGSVGGVANVDMWVSRRTSVGHPREDRA